MYIYEHLLEICFQIIGCARSELFKNKQKKQLYYLFFFLFERLCEISIFPYLLWL